MTTFSNPIPADDPKRQLAVARPDDENLKHLAVIGNICTLLLSGEDTNGKYSLMDMTVPASQSGPPPHRHDFEEMFYVLEGQIEVTIRDKTVVLNAGEVLNIPANAPHSPRNSGGTVARVLCMTTTTGLEGFFSDVGTPVATRTTPPPKLSEAEQGELRKKAAASAPKHGIDLLAPA